MDFSILDWFATFNWVWFRILKKFLVWYGVVRITLNIGVEINPRSCPMACPLVTLV